MIGWDYGFVLVGNFGDRYFGTEPSTVEPSSLDGAGDKVDLGEEWRVGDSGYTKLLLLSYVIFSLCVILSQSF